MHVRKREEYHSDHIDDCTLLRHIHSDALRFSPPPIPTRHDPIPLPTSLLGFSNKICSKGGYIPCRHKQNELCDNLPTGFIKFDPGRNACEKKKKVPQ